MGLSGARCRSVFWAEDGVLTILLLCVAVFLERLWRKARFVRLVDLPTDGLARSTGLSVIGNAGELLTCSVVCFVGNAFAAG